MIEGVSFVVPVHNGAAWIRETLAAILSQADGRALEVIVVDDCSGDGSSALLRHLAGQWPLRIVAGRGRGAAAAINTGVRAARFPIVCQVDQDVVVHAGWMRALVDELADPAVAAAQGYYTTDRNASLCARAMSLDLEQRYAAIEGRETDHVCTGNAAYRADALHRVGLFDETFGYGYDNDMSYRLRAAGYRLVLSREAPSVHRWREGIAGYIGQQYGFGYGRLDIVAKHPARVGGDAVSPAGMMAHPLLMSLVVAGLVGAVVTAAAGGPWQPLAAGAAILIVGLAIERLIAGVRAARRFGAWTPLLFPLLHLGRDLAWVAAVVMWSARRVVGRPSMPAHSMRPRDADRASDAGRIVSDPVRPRPRARAMPPPRILVLIPAHNEAASLTAVVDELRAWRRDLDILVVDDGSTDETTTLVGGLGVRWLRLPRRMGIGNAVRAGLRYAVRAGFDVVVRMDGDGQHRAEDVERLLAPVVGRRADVALGSRYTTPDGERIGLGRLAKRLLGACLSAVIGKPVTDPTSGFLVLGPRAASLLAEHHPTGFPEPELRLFLSHNALSAVEVPVRARPRLRGRTSLTPGRLLVTAARVALAMLMVPLRHRVPRTRGLME